MTDLNEYLAQKRLAVLAKQKAAEADPRPVSVKARVRAMGRSGVREIRIRDFQIISDSKPDLAGYDLGPGSPEMQLGVLGSCITHITLIQAALREVPLDAVEVEVEADQHPPVGETATPSGPLHPHNIRYRLRLESTAPPETLRALHEAIEAACPILSLLVNPQKVAGEMLLNGETISRLSRG